LCSKYSDFELRFPVSGFGFWVSGLQLGAWGMGFGFWVLAFWLEGCRFKVKVEGLRLRFEGFG
jgi:hypothetical protein